MFVLLRRAPRLFTALLLILACALPALAAEDSGEIRMPVDLTVVPLEGVETPLVTETPPAPSMPAAPAEKPQEQKPAAKAAQKAAPPEKKPELPAAKLPAEKKAPAPVPAPAAKAPAPAQDGVGQLREIQVSAKDGLVVLRLVTDRPVGAVTSLNFKNPRRLAVDLSGRWRRVGAAAVRVADGPVKAVRVGEHPDHLRLVLDFREDGDGPDLVPEIAKTPDGVTVSFPLKR